MEGNYCINKFDMLATLYKIVQKIISKTML